MGKYHRASEAAFILCRSLALAAVLMVLPVVQADSVTYCQPIDFAIPDASGTGTTDTLTATDSGVIDGLDVRIDATHTWIGDLAFVLTNDGTGTSVVLYDQECGNFDDLSLTFVDGAPDAVGTLCDSPYTGTFDPIGSLADFNGEELNGSWTLSAFDLATGDTGTVTEWCLDVEFTPPPACTETNNFVANQWQLFSLACDPGAADTVEDIFTTGTSNLSSGDYFDGSSGNWVVYERDALSDDYNQLLLTDSMETGRGYWVKTVDTGKSITQDEIPNEEQSEPVVPGGAQTLEGDECSTPAVLIPDNDPNGIGDMQTVTETGILGGLDVSIAATHTWVGDLIFELTNDISGTSVVLLDRPGNPALGGNGCSADNIDVTLDDDAVTAAEDQCVDMLPAPAIGGTHSPNNPLSAFIGEDLNGDWTLSVSDNVGGDSGTLDEWCLKATTQELGSRLNMIGNPYEVDVDWTDAMVDDGGTMLTIEQADPIIGGTTRACSMMPVHPSCVVSSTAWKWNGSSHQTMSPSGSMMNNTLSAFDGFWVDVYKPGVEIILPRPAAARPANRAATGPQIAGPIQQPQFNVPFRQGWQIRLIAESGNLRDDGNIFGQFRGSLDGYDHRDLIELAPFGNTYLTVVFPHPEWEANGDDFASDIRRLRSGRSGDWAFAVRSAGTPEPVTLSWEGAVSALDAAVLIDVSTGEQVATGADGSYTFVPAGSDHRFIWRQLDW